MTYSTTSTPLSLQANPETFSEWMDPQGAVPPDMPWTIWLGENVQSPALMQASCNQPGSAKMVFATPWSNYLQYNSDICLSLIGGWNGSPNVADGTGMVTPFEWPQEVAESFIGTGGLWATDVQVTEHFVDNSATRAAGDLPPYRLALYHVAFQSLPYDVDATQGDLGYNPNWIEIKSRSTNEVQQTPVGQYVFTSDPNLPSLLGTLFTFGVSYIEVVAHRIPAEKAIGGTTGRESLNPIAQYCGRVNSDTFMGITAGKLLFDSIEQAPFGDWQGNNIYDVHLLFKYRAAGWNTGLQNDGTFAQIQTAKGGNPPFTPQAFVTMMNVLMPPQA